MALIPLQCHPRASYRVVSGHKHLLSLVDPRFLGSPRTNFRLQNLTPTQPTQPTQPSQTSRSGRPSRNFGRYLLLE